MDPKRVNEYGQVMASDVDAISKKPGEGGGKSSKEIKETKKTQ